MKTGKPIAFILLAFVIGATVSQGSFAFADDSATNPFRAMWDAISELQVKTESLQAQIDDLKTQQVTTSATRTVTKNSESSIAIDVAGGDAGQTLVTLIVANAGPDSAVGVKLTTFYQPSLFRINFIQGAECSDGSRGIIECYLGTIVAGSETRVIVDATPISLGQQAIITSDLSSITTDVNLANNHAEIVFTTSAAPVAQPSVPSAPVETPPAAPVEESPVEQTEGSKEQPSEQSQEGEQSTEQTGEESDSEPATDGSAGESSGDEGSDTGAGESGGSESGDAGTSSEGSAGDSGAGDSGSDSGSGESSGDSGAGSSGDSGSEGGSSGDSGGSSGGSSGDGSGGSDGGSSGGDSGGEG